MPSTNISVCTWKQNTSGREKVEIQKKAADCFPQLFVYFDANRCFHCLKCCNCEPKDFPPLPHEKQPASRTNAGCFACFIPEGQDAGHSIAGSLGEGRTANSQEPSIICFDQPVFGSDFLLISTQGDFSLIRAATQKNDFVLQFSF